MIRKLLGLGSPSLIAKRFGESYVQGLKRFLEEWEEKMNRHQRNKLVCPKCGKRGLRRHARTANGERRDDLLMCKYCSCRVEIAPRRIIPARADLKVDAEVEADAERDAGAAAVIGAGGIESTDDNRKGVGA